MRVLAFSAIALATVATPAFAQSEPTPFTGLTATAIVGVDHVSADGDKATGFQYGGALGYDVAVGKLVVGAEGEGTFSTVKDCDVGFCVEAGRDLYAGGRIGINISNQSLLYVKAGYTNARVKATLNNTTLDAANLDGVRGGVGVEGRAGKMFVRVEYRYSNYEADFSRHQGVVGLGVRF